MAARLRPRQRLRTRAEFDRAFRRGVRLAGPLFVLIAVPNGTGVDRLGLAVSRRVGGSVVRNRVRRMLRESFRRKQDAVSGGHDLVIVAQGEMAGRTQSEVDIALRERLERLRRTARRTGSAVAASD
jgi:ribonuclease P protein component